MSTSRLIITVFFIACRPAGEEWISEDIHHDTQLDTGESGDDSVLLTLVTGAVEIIPKTSIDGEIEIVIGEYNASADTLEETHCAVAYSISSVTWRDDCENCEEAYDFSVSGFQTLLNEDERCEEAGVSESDLTEAHPGVGFGSDRLFIDEGEGWVSVADTWYDEGLTHFEWAILGTE